MLTFKRKLLSAAFLSVIATNTWAITQDGGVGATSTGYIDAPFEINRYVRISGLQDISFDINPLARTVPLSSEAVVICLYSSTGRANITADTNTTVDRINGRATLVNANTTSPFELTIDNVDVLTAAPPSFDSSIGTTDCGDNQGKHNLVITLPQIPPHAGTYTATVSLTVSASDM